MRTYFQHNKSRLPIPETRPDPRRANQIEKRDGKQDCEPCLACGSVSHFFTRCYLVLGQDIKRIPENNRKTFRGNMEALFFRKRVDDFKASQKSFED